MQIGVIMVIGLAAKNAILIVEFAKVRVDRGMDPLKAAIQAAGLRLRPILMTSFAFIIGCLPLCMASGAELQRVTVWVLPLSGACSLPPFLVSSSSPCSTSLLTVSHGLLGVSKKAKTRTADDYM